MRLALFLLFPALELYLLVKVGGMIGALNMVLWVFVSALIGMWAVRAQGQSAMLKARAELEAGRVPQTPFLDGVLLFFGGILLILPGLLTDAAGLFLLVPPLRHWAALRLASYITSRQNAAAGGHTRIFFFSSGGFPGAGAPSADRPFPPDPFNGPGQGGAVPPGPFRDASEPPRQATIIDSTAIDIEASVCSDGTEEPASPRASDGKG